MILQFPTPYRDELLFCIIARYHLRSGNVFWKHTLEDLFGKRSISATAILPSGIRSLVESLPINTTINEQSLIYNHTMFPFYTSFLPKKTALSIYEAMLSDDGKKIYMQSGIMASSIPQNKWFKYCPKCFKEDLERYSELYWHRIHQLPGRLICSKHRLWLEDSSVPIIHSYNHRFVAPNPTNCDLTKGNNVNDSILHEFSNFMELVESLLNSNFDRKSFSHFTNFYRKHLFTNGFANYNGNVYQKKLYKAFNSFYSSDFLACLNVKIEQGNSWLVHITRKHRKSFHPYYHLLVLNFWGLSINSIFQETSLSISPFGNPNWPCLNIVCPDHKKEVIPNMAVRRCGETKKPVGRFTCPTCGFSYTKKGGNLNKEDRFNYDYVMDYGFLWHEKLQDLLKKGISNSKIAVILNVSSNTVMKHAKITKCIAHSPKQKSNEDKSESIERHRKEWLDLQREDPNLNKTKLREQRPEIYSFLYRYDIDWLHKNSPITQKRKTTIKRVNWKERDQEILQGVKKATEDLKQMDKTMRRITLKSLGNLIGQEDLLVQHLNKMPKSKAFIEQVLETEQDYRIRRAKWAIQELRKSGEPIVNWRVLRKARIHTKFTKELNELIESYRK